MTFYLVDADAIPRVILRVVQGSSALTHKTRVDQWLVQSLIARRPPNHGAFGGEPVSLGDAANATAIGGSSSAAGINVTAIGAQATASAGSAGTLGSAALSSGNDAVAVGVGTTASATATPWRWATETTLSAMAESVQRSRSGRVQQHARVVWPGAVYGMKSE